MASVILYATLWVVSMISGQPSALFGEIGGKFSNLLIALIAVGFFIWSLKLHPGKEEFLETLPQIILAIAIVELVRNGFTQVPELSIPFTWVGLAWGLSSVFLANTIVKKFWR